MPKTAGIIIYYSPVVYNYDAFISNAHQVEEVMQTLVMLGSLELHLLLVVCIHTVVLAYTDHMIVSGHSWFIYIYPMFLSDREII